MRSFIVGLLVALSLGVAIPLLASPAAMAGPGERDFFGVVR